MLLTMGDSQRELSPEVTKEKNEFPYESSPIRRNTGIIVSCRMLIHTFIFICTISGHRIFPGLSSGRTDFLLECVDISLLFMVQQVQCGKKDRVQEINP
jgi:hypothetical protein